ncbi:ZP4 protein, partial [Polypterus senegalus]
MVPFVFRSVVWTAVCLLVVQCQQPATKICTNEGMDLKFPGRASENRLCVSMSRSVVSDGECAVADSEKVPCGGDAVVGQADCEAENCCYDSSSSSTSSCYYGNTDSSYSSYYGDADYPVTRVLRDPVDVEVRIVNRSDPNLVLTLGNCWVTPGPSASNQPQWSLLVNGCPYLGDDYLTSLINVDATSGVAYPSHYKRFEFKMFAFVSASQQGLSQMVYIFCSAAVCYPSAVDSCVQSCPKTRSGRDVDQNVKANAYRKNVLVHSGPVFLTVPDTQTSKLQGKGSREVHCDHRLVAATLKNQLGSSRLPPTRKMGLDLARLEDQAVSNEFARSLCENLDLGATYDPNVMWKIFRDKGTEGYVDVSVPRRRCFISQLTLNIIERSHSTQLDGNSGN